MNKQDLLREIVARVEQLDDNTTVTQKEVNAVLKVLPEIVKDVLRKDDKIVLNDLGTFSVKEVPERRGTIVLGKRKGEEYVTPAHKEPKFKITKSIKEMFLD